MKSENVDTAQPADVKGEFFWGCLPFVATPPEVVKRMLELARVSPSDTVMDLGCGDGRILMAALEQFGARRAIGYEIREDLVGATLKTFQSKGLGGKVKLVKGDLAQADLAEATVIAIYLTGTCNDMLRSKFEGEVKPGTRIVSHGFGIEGWKASIMDETTGSKVFLYETPQAFREGGGLPLEKSLRFWI